MAVEPRNHPGARLRRKVTVETGSGGTRARRSERITGTLAEALALEARLRGTPAADFDRSVLDAVDRYLALGVGVKGRKFAPQTIVNYRGVRNRWLAPTALAAIPVRSLTFGDLEDHYRRLAAGGYRVDGVDAGPLEAGSVRMVHKLVGTALSMAVRAGWVTQNVALIARPPAPPEPAIAGYDLTEVARILEAADLEAGELVQLALATAARRSELAAIRWRDVDLATGSLTIAGAVGPAPAGSGSRWVRKTTKTGKPRTMALPEATVAMLRARYVRQSAQAAEAGLALERLDDCAVLSTDLEADYTSPGTIGDRFYRVRDRAGVRLRLHDLRHIACSEMAAAGVPDINATARSGHASNQLYADLYSHRRVNLADPSTEALGATWAAIQAARQSHAEGDAEA